MVPASSRTHPYEAGPPTASVSSNASSLRKLRAAARQTVHRVVPADGRAAAPAGSKVPTAPAASPLAEKAVRRLRAARTDLVEPSTRMPARR